MTEMIEQTAKVVPWNEVEPVTMLPGVVRRTLGSTDKLMIVEFRLTAGAAVPQHEHPHDQVGYVVSGAATMNIDGVEVVCRAGDSYQIPGGVRHSVRFLTDTVLIDAFSPPREDYA